MANRSYLYSCNQIPGENDGTLAMTGISEWNYDIPLVFKILISDNPYFCKSSIFDSKEILAICSDYDKGVDALISFFKKYPFLDSNDGFLISLNFLRASHNRGKYFILECGELMDYEIAELPQKYDQLIEGIRNIDILIDEFIAPFSQRKDLKKSFLSFLPTKKEASDKSLEKHLDSLGIGNWSNTLYFAPFAPKTIKKLKKYEIEKIIEFIPNPENQFCWFKKITINRQQQKVQLITYENWSLEVDLINENREINDRINFLFNIEAKEKNELTHYFSFMQGFGDDEIWRLSSAAMQHTFSTLTLRGTDEKVTYSFVE